MTESSEASAWDAALERAEALTAAARVLDTPVADSWEDTAIRDLIAFALYSVAHRDRTSIEKTPLGRAIVPLFARSDLEQVVRTELGAAGHVLDRHDPDDPVSVRWAWLHRTWDPASPIKPPWEGLKRSTAAGRPDPAIDLMLNSAGNVLSSALAAERGARPVPSRVQVTGGPFAGHTGTVQAPAWQVTTGDAVAPGPPVGYLVSLDHPDPEPLPARHERILATDLASGPWGIVVLDEQEPAPAGGCYRLTPGDAAARLTELTAAVAQLEQVQDDAAQLAEMTVPSADPGSQAVHDRLVASVAGGGRLIELQLVEARALRDEFAAALQDYRARTGRAAD